MIKARWRAESKKSFTATAFNLNIPDFQARLFKEMCLFQWSQWCSQGQPSTPGVQSKQQIKWICFRQIERSHGITSTLFTWKILLLRFILLGCFVMVSFHTHCTSGFLYVSLRTESLSKGPFKTGTTWVKLHPYHREHIAHDYPPAFQTGFEMTLCKYTCKLLPLYPQIRQEPYIKSSVTLKASRFYQKMTGFKVFGWDQCYYRSWLHWRFCLMLSI